MLAATIQVGNQNVINPRRACAVRVTVFVLCVCLSVSLHSEGRVIIHVLCVCLSVDDYSRTTGYDTAYERHQQLQCYKGNVTILLKMTAFKRYGVKTSEKPICIMSTGLPRPGLARSAHCGRIKLLRGYVSKCSAALIPLKITQLACER